MDRNDYLEALGFCYKTEAAGAIMGELAMLLRKDLRDKRKLDIVRRKPRTASSACGCWSASVDKPATDAPSTSSR